MKRYVFKSVTGVATALALVIGLGGVSTADSSNRGVIVNSSVEVGDGNLHCEDSRDCSVEVIEGLLGEGAFAADELEEQDDMLVLNSNDVVIEVPSDPENPVVLETVGDSEALEIGLPFAQKASPVEEGDAGQLEFDNNNETITSVLPYEDGSLQMVVTMLDSSAPEEFEYDLNLPEGFTSVFNDDGSVLFLDAEGELFAGVAAPWAKDNSGRSVPTRYEMRENKLVQVISTTEEVTYPIVADPFFGKKLFSSI
ncbi:MAG: hypothetical protein J6M18_01990 [Actinomycetaceae bacterium]|nr:hypothetical protein [Actinomycetaceae bacterium]